MDDIYLAMHASFWFLETLKIALVFRLVMSILRNKLIPRDTQDIAVSCFHHNMTTPTPPILLAST
jgi:hypothetical protein